MHGDGIGLGSHFYENARNPHIEMVKTWLMKSLSVLVELFPLGFVFRCIFSVIREATYGLLSVRSYSKNVILRIVMIWVPLIFIEAGTCKCCHCAPLEAPWATA